MFCSEVFKNLSECNKIGPHSLSLNGQKGFFLLFIFYNINTYLEINTYIIYTMNIVSAKGNNAQFSSNLLFAFNIDILCCLWPFQTRNKQVQHSHSKTLHWS